MGLNIFEEIKNDSRTIKDVTAEHAYKEGEGDRSLDYWRQVHKEFLESELESIDMAFSEDAKVICEEFELIK